MIWKYIGIGALVIAMITGVYHRGANDKELELRTEFQEARLKQLEEAKATEDRLVKEKNELDKYYTEMLFDVQENVDDVLDSVQSGERRLYVKTVKADCSVPKDASTTSVDRREGRAELDPDTAREIIRLTERGDRYAIQLNTCVDMYNKVRKEINAVHE